VELPVHCEQGVQEQPPVMSLMIEELEELIKRENSNITARRTGTKPKKDSSTQQLSFQPQLQFCNSEQKQKAE
jgi:hypothetical protein